MSNLPQSDLILAGRFVDGDLPAHEAAQAEARIAKDPAFAAAVEQIRDQSSLLGRFPKFEPADDLANRTLQASMDQVKAIMGAWPIESDREKVNVAPEASSSSFDWKSTAALAASLAGIFMVGAMLWQSNQPSESNIAMNEVTRDREDTAMTKSSSMLDDAVESEVVSKQAVAASEIQKQFKSAVKSDQVFDKAAQAMGNYDQVDGKAARQEIASLNSLPGQGKAISGTPMARSRTPVQTANKSQTTLANASAPVAQIWCVSQDSTAAKSSVCDILNSNQIAVQREQQPPATDNADAVEAFYVAATPKQMKLAMSEISNNADIQMIEIPSTNSPIADAIQKQFTQGMPIPETFQPSQAMGQHLFTNSVPRKLPTLLGPVPPILKSGSKIEGLESSFGKSADLALQQKATVPAPAANATAGAGFGAEPDAEKEETADSEIVIAEPASNEAPQSAQLMRQQAELDKYLDDSNQLQQFLILVRGGEENK